MKKSIMAVILIICLVSGTVLGSKNYKVSAAGGPEEGLVIIASVQDPSFCIDVDNYGTKNGTKVQLWKTKTGKPADVANQYYYLEKNSDGTYSFRLAYTEKLYLHAATEKEMATIVHVWEGNGDNGRYKTIYNAPSEEEGRQALDEVKETWDERYPRAMTRWYDNWDAISPIFKFSSEVRSVIYTTYTDKIIMPIFAETTDNYCVFKKISA